MKIQHPPRQDGIEIYLRELQQFAPLSGEEAPELFRLASTGDAAAQERILLAHLSLVTRIAYKYTGYGLPLADLISEGNLGLLRAVELYDPSFGVAFSTYAGVWIKQRIHRAITAQSQVVRIPVWRSQRLRKLDRLHDELNSELGRDSTLTDLADRIGLSARDLESIAADRVQVNSLDLTDETGAPSLDLPDDEAATPGELLSREELHEEIISALDGLDDTELQILSLKFGLLNEKAESYREMAPRFGRSREWIRRIGEQALAKVSSSLRAAGAMPRAIIQKRRDKTRRRLEALARKRSSLPVRVSLFQMVLMQEVTPILTIL